MLPPYLTDAEVAEICRPRKQGAAQIKFLRALGLKVTRRADGTPLVWRDSWEDWRVCALPWATLQPEQEPQARTLPRWADTPLGQWQARQRDNRAIANDWKVPPLTRQQMRARTMELSEKRAALVRFHAAKRRCAKLQRTPPWADMKAIREFYVLARALSVETGIEHHVDHDIPLQGTQVSGLHVPANLQILTGVENSRKRNKFEPC
jgi:hypothetical protein